LQKQKDKTIKLVLPVVEMSLVVTDQGLFALADQAASEPNVTLTIGPEVFNAYIAGGKDAAVKHVKGVWRCGSGSGRIDLGKSAALGG